MKSLLIFDLDGTLLNTIADMAESSNYALTKCGFPTHEISAYRFFIGNGINKLFERILPESEKNQDNILKLRTYFLEHYETHNSELTKPYAGMAQVLLKLQSAGIMIAVASNKYHRATEKLVHFFFPEIEFVAIFGQREGVSVKPDPTIVNDILAVAKVSNTDEVLYIGDSGVDMQTAKNAGVDACGVTWGFRPRTELMEFSPKYLIDNTAEILEILNL